MSRRRLRGLRSRLRLRPAASCFKRHGPIAVLRGKPDMKPQGETVAGGTLQGQGVSARPWLSAALRRAWAGCSVVLAACPQLLDDEFVSLPPEALVGSAGAGAGVGGSGAASGGNGGASPGGRGGAAGAAANAGSGSREPAVPVLLATVPADGARGVSADAEISLTFSAPMDTASVQAAYRSSSLPAAQMTFTWSAGDTVLRIVPGAVLEVVRGSDPGAVVARQYALDITAGARDKAGNALAPVHVAFSVARSITQALGPAQDRDLTGNWRTDSSYGLAYCERIDTTFCMGDSPAAGNPGYRGFLTFDLDVLPAELLALSAAELSTTVDQKFGTPFTDLGELRSEHVTFSTIGDEAFDAVALSAPRTLASAGDVGSAFRLSVLSEVESDRAARGRSQFRLAFEAESDADGVADMLVSDWTSASLTVTYLTP